MISAGGRREHHSFTQSCLAILSRSCFRRWALWRMPRVTQRRVSGDYCPANQSGRAGWNAANGDLQSRQTSGHYRAREGAAFRSAPGRDALLQRRRIGKRGSLTFDKYDANQIVQLAGVEDKEDKFAGLMVGESKPGGDSPTRIWVGRKEDGAATVALMDGNGRKRLVMEVPENGSPRISFLDADGKILSELVPAKAK